jgi:hypothetical protein
MIDKQKEAELALYELIKRWEYLTWIQKCCILWIIRIGRVRYQWAQFRLWWFYKV